jgi:calcineurin-like phosphoesterase family protein
MSKTNTTRREFIGTVGAGFAAASLGAGGSAFGAPAKKQVPPIDFNMIYGYAPEANVEKDDFTFAFWADPQICNVKQDVRMKSGKWEDLPKELQTTEGRLRKSVEMTNAVNPDFVLVLGDVVHQSGEMEYYERYIKTTEGLKPPQYLLAGNHDFCEPWYANQKYKSEEGKEFFGNFRWAQRTLNGLDKVNYSFDAGRWHIVMFSVPGVGGNLQAQFLKDYPQHIEWLEKDLRQHRDKPTIFCSHPPFLPVGRVSMEHYGPNSRQRRELVEIITRQGNVKLCLFGHIHNTVSSIPKVAWRYKGAAWFTLPTTSFDGVRDHDYEEDARTSYGFGTIRVKGDRLGAMKFRTLAGEEFTFGYDDLKEYDHAYMDSLWDDF